MANRDNHYETAFEAYLRERRLPYIAVDEARRAQWSDGSLKSLDFIVSAGAHVPQESATRPAGVDGIAGSIPPHRLQTSGTPAALAPSWLVDVKGRRFPSGEQREQYWKNWSTRDDMRSLRHWQKLFGPQFTGLFVFAYRIVGRRAPLPAEALFAHQQRLYGFVAIRVDDYAAHARPLSPRWDTVAMPAARFRELAFSLEDALCASTPVATLPQSSVG